MLRWPYAILTRLLFAEGPVAISIDVEKSFSFYSSGVYYEPKCGNKPEDLNHAVRAQALAPPVVVCLRLSVWFRCSGGRCRLWRRCGVWRGVSHRTCMPLVAALVFYSNAISACVLTFCSFDLPLQVRNSWSTYWGDDGYVKMSVRDNNCGVATMPTMPDLNF